MSDKIILDDEKKFQAYLEGEQKRVDDAVAKLDSFTDLDDKIGEVQKTIKELGEAVKKSASRMVDKGGRSMTKLPVTKAEFAAGAFKALNRGKTAFSTDRYGQIESVDGPFAEWQKASDDLQVEAALMSVVKGAPVRKEDCGLFKSHYLPAFSQVQDILKDAMDISATAPGAGDWIFTEMSSQIDKLLSMQFRVLQFIRQVTIPRSPFQFPRQTGRVTFFGMAEEPLAPPTGRTIRVQDAIGSTDMTGNVLFTGERIAGIFTITQDAEQDSIVALVPFARQEMIEGLGRALEDGVVNGDADGTHQDTDIEALTALDHRKRFDGLRKFALANTTSRKDAAGGKIDSNDNWRDFVREGALSQMGAYGDIQQFGSVPGELVCLSGGKVFNQLLAMPEFRHLNTFGSQGTIGGIDANAGFRPDGMWLVNSEMMREDLNALGVDDGITDDLATFLIFHRQAWLMANLQAPRIQVFNDSFFRLYGQTGIMLDWRGDLQAIKDPTAATQKHTVCVFDIGT